MNRDRETRFSMRTLLRGLAAVLASVIFSTAAPAADTTGTAASASGETLENIVVTAQRREETVQSVPISINAIGQQELATLGITSIENIAALTPGLQFALPNGFSAAFTTIAMRGLNTNTGPPTVGVYLDDTTISSRLSGTANQGNVYPYSFDLNRVEVARGPQGTLFGAGSEAGTVRFITNQPSLTEFSGMVRGELAETEGGRMTYETGIAMGGPIIQDQLGYRFSAWERSDGGFVNRINPIPGPGYLSVVAPDANTNKKTVIKGALAFEAGDFLITPAYYYQRTHQDDAGRFYAAFSDASAGIFNNGVLLPEVWTDRWNMESIKAEDKNLPFADLTVDASYFYREATEVLDESAFVCPGMHTPFPGGPGGCGNPLGIGYAENISQVAYTPTNMNVEAYTAEARLASNSKDSRISWVAGFYFEHRAQRDFQIDYDPADYAQSFPNNPVPPGSPLNAYIIQDQHELFVDVQTAVYAQFDFRITDALTLTVGERVAHVTVDGADTTAISYLTGAPPYAPFHGVNNPVTPHLGLEYKINPYDLVYFTFGEGYRPGGGNGAIPNSIPGSSCFGQPQVPGTYAPDSVHAFELGTKDTFLDGRLQVDASVFYNEWRGIQQYLSETCGPYAFGTNAGNAVSDGLDLQLRAILTPELRFDLNAGYVNAYYTENAYEPANVAPPSPSTLIVGKDDKVGILPQVVAPWNINATLTYEVPVNGTDKFHAALTTLYTSQSSGPFITQNVGSLNYYPLATPDPATHMYNGRLGYTTGKLDVTCFINNIFNNTPALSKYQANNTTGYNLISYTTFRPRTIGVTANYSF
ncbi:MAG: TonB-dependent receptor [Steroidobacterales bacterium]